MRFAKFVIRLVPEDIVGFKSHAPLTFGPYPQSGVNVG